MVSLRKWLILVHRYLGIALGLLFVMWFVSGIAMIYARDMPRLTPEVRLQRMPALDLSRVHLTAEQAFAQAGLAGNPGRVVMLTVMDRPAYRFSRGQPVTLFADTGEPLKMVGETESLAIASRFMSLPRSTLRHIRVIERADQWTISQRRQMPLHKIAADDAARTELYVSERLGEVVVQTTRGSRALAWIAAIPHWLYFAPLRVNDALWRQVVLWTSGLGALTALVGIVLAVIQFAPSAPFRLNRMGSYVPYAGLMRWHYVAGVIFGAFALTWVFSGLLSMEPWDWASSGSSSSSIPQALGGGSLDLSLFPPIDAAVWDGTTRDQAVKEIELRRLQGEPYYVLRNEGATPLLMAAQSLQPRREGFSLDSILQRVKQGNPDRAILDTQLLSDYDAYYYDGDRSAPLPVLRVKFDDPNHTWVYVDPGMSELVARFSRRERVQRWLYHGLHSLDFSFWYYNRPLWDIAVIALCTGGTVLSTIGVVLGVRRVRRAVRRAAGSGRAGTL